MATSVVPPPGEELTGDELTAASATSAARQSARRTLALWIPDWPVMAAVQAGLVRADEPVALLHAGRVVAMSATARQGGVRSGMRQRSAQEACPDLIVLPRQEGYEVISFEPVATAAEQVVAAIEVIRPGLLVAPARGPSRYYGGDAALARAILGQVISETGHECEVGIADGLLAAILAAQAGALVPAGTAAGFLAAHPMQALGRALGGREGDARGLDDLIDTWRRLGITTLGDLAALPRGQVLSRFGPVGDWAWQLARGQDVRVATTGRSDSEVSADMVLDPPVDNVERAAFAARGCAERLYDLLASRGLGFTRLEVLARTEDGGHLCRTWRVESLDVAGVVDRVRWQLEGWLSGRSGERPSAGLIWLSLIAHDAAPGGAYHASLWGRSGKTVLAERTAERVDTLLKNDGLPGLYLAVPQGGRDPRSRIRLVAWGDDPVPARPREAPWPGQLPDPAPATIYAEPPAIEILDAAGTPVRIDIRLRMSGEPAICVLDTSGARPGTDRWAITAWAGPWPVVERWWSGRPRQVFAQLLVGSALVGAHTVAGGPARSAGTEAPVSEGALLLVVYSADEWRIEGRYD